MLDYMKRKYGEVFVDDGAFGGQPDRAYTMRRLHRVNHPKDRILVRALGKEKVVFQDNYLAYLLRDEIEEHIYALAEPVFGECKVYYKIPALVFPPEFPADMEVDAFLGHPLSMARIYTYVRNAPAEVGKQSEAFLTALARRSYVVGGVISYPAGEEMYAKITAENFEGDIYQGYKSLTEAVFSMEEKGGLSYLRWKGERENR